MRSENEVRLYVQPMIEGWCAMAFKCECGLMDEPGIKHGGYYLTPTLGVAYEGHKINSFRRDQLDLADYDTGQRVRPATLLEVA